MTDLPEQLDPKDHHEALFNARYLRWFHLQGKEWVMEIVKVEKDVELTLPGGAKDKKPVVHFKGAERPLVLNRTNGKMIAKILGNKPSEWPGRSVVLYPTTTRMYDQDTKQMETRGCIRVKAVKGNQ